MLKNQRGITLVALVVTIIVLIILATISISVALDDDGIIGRAEDAKQHQINADAQYNEFRQEVTDYIDGQLQNAGIS